MDPSSRPGIILGSTKVEIEDIQPEEWLVIFNTVLEKCRPQLKYLPGFRPIEETLNCYLNDYDERVTDLKIIQCPEDFGMDTRCISLTRIGHKIGGVSPSGKQYGVRFITTRELLLTQKGKIVLWEHKCEQVVQHGLGFRQHRTGIKEIAVHCEFIYVEVEAWQLSSAVALGVFRSLFQLVNKGVADRAERLRSTQGLATFLDGVSGRMNCLGFVRYADPNP